MMKEKGPLISIQNPMTEENDIPMFTKPIESI